MIDKKIKIIIIIESLCDFLNKYNVKLRFLISTIVTKEKTWNIYKKTWTIIIIKTYNSITLKWRRRRKNKRFLQRKKIK